LSDDNTDTTNTMAPVSFWTAPASYIHWASRAKPAIFWSIVVGSLGPVVVVCVTLHSSEEETYRGYCGE